MAITNGPNSLNTFFQQDGSLFYWKPGHTDKVGPFADEDALSKAYHNYSGSDQFMSDLEEFRKNSDLKKNKNLKETLVASCINPAHDGALYDLIRDMGPYKKDRLLVFMLGVLMRSRAFSVTPEEVHRLLTED